MKMLVAPKSGPVMLMLDRGEFVQPNRPSVVTYSQYLETQILKKIIGVIESDLLEEATDSEFEKFWNDSEKDRELAVESFLSKYGTSVFDKKDENSNEEKLKEAAAKAELQAKADAANAEALKKDLAAVKAPPLVPTAPAAKK